MLSTFFKYFIILICTIYIYHRLLNIRKHLTISYISFMFIYSIVLSGVYLIIPHSLSDLYILLVGISVFTIMNIFFTHSKLQSLTCTILSYAISYGIYFFSLTIAATTKAVLFRYLKISINLDILLYALQLLITIFIFRINRLKNGMSFIKNSNTNYLGLSIGVILLISSIIMHNNNGSLLYLLPYVFVLISFIFLFIWWRSRLKATYIKAVYNRELEILKNELATLKSDNEVLSSLLHKDNKLIPALELTVRNFICSDNPSAQDKDKILAQLNKLSMERKGIINNCSTFNSTLPSTGYMVIDALLNYMMQKCSASDITMNVNIIGNLDTFIGKIIDESDFNTILADLIENAFIATKYNNGKNIYININSEVEFPTLDIYDSGNAFDDNVLMNLGMKRITTHKDSGGTGIGLSSTYGLCKKYNASFVITEDINSENTTFKDTNSKDLISEKSSSNVITFTKKVSIIFDDKSEYRLKTNNDFHNLQKLAKRVDLIIEN